MRHAFSSRTLAGALAGSMLTAAVPAGALPVAALLPAAMPALPALAAIVPSALRAPAPSVLPRLGDPDARALDRAQPDEVTWARISFVTPGRRPTYGPVLPAAEALLPVEDPHRITSFVMPVAPSRPLVLPGAALAVKSTAQVPAPASPPAPADRPEDLRAAIVEALKSNPDIQIALARQDDAKYGVDEAVAGYLPHMDIAVAIGNEFNDPQLGAATNLRRGEGLLSVRQNLFDFGTTINDIKRARASYRAAQWGTREKIEAVSYDISTAYLSVLERQKLLALGEEELAAAQKILKMVTTQNELGLTTPADVSRAKARSENVQAQIQDRRSALEQARESYRRLTDRLPARAADVPSAAAALPPSADAAVAMIADHSPRMAQAVQDRRSIERQRASQTGTFFPKVGLLAQANWRDDVQGRTGQNRDARGMVTVTYGFLNGGADVAVRNRLSARLREADYELERRRREVEQDLRIDFNALEAARAKTATIDSEIASSQKVVQLYTQQFREGKRTVFDLLDSQQILFNARASQVTNGTAMQLAEFRVLQKLGGLFDLLSQGEKLPKLVVPAKDQPRR
ncbi:TolC family outer membrane protein [Sphingomonas corticis]|jgi:TolC family type I secretion outer membrane protein|uniref:TolC family outer membrane protein n=1 Tax=Sphingomonas corticis TaxID=2722791 RepID=A0ABX1CNP4_9SPHN|nr:TolC family outer membrane protein [Sphingomonas corticis]NJR78431.1 TolC family outer membrane protein [Sphingomonas corticis]